MQKLSDQLDNLSVSHEPSVGVFYHPDMLLHKPVKYHPENPDRLTGILSHLEKQNLLSRCKVYSDFDSISKEVVADLHGENYVDYVEGLWDDNIEREVRFYKDTYYNKHSIRAANLAANALKLAVDEMFEGKINRAYGIVRPPGHHAAADNNRISGFCIYNNVALAAKYAAKKYGVKRILIYDWDVHHGDSTSRFFYEDASVLYISLHRYDNGNFYPGKFGDMKNIGENQGKGYNLNLTWSLPHPYCIVGDHEYVYANERVFLPIIKEFDPELIFISAGFDSSRGDPIGGIDLTQDGYAYMTKRLLDLAPSRTIIALEGGYNVDSISVASEACLRILLGEEMPLKCCENEETLQAMVFKCAPSDLVVQTVKSAIEIYQEYWPLLTKDQSILTYEEECIKRTSSAEVEIAAGHKDAVIIKQDKFLKRLKESEVKLYKDLSDIHDGDHDLVEYLEESKELLKFASKCTGMTKIDGKDYAILENICYKYPKASVIDFKIGRVTYLPTHSDKVKNEHIVKAEKTISSKLGFRISGLLLKDRHGKLMHKAYKNEIYYDITTSNIADHIARFLKSNDAEHINIEAAKYYIKYLSEMIEFFEAKNTRAWIGTSVLLVLDNTRNYYKATWIDIGKYLPLDAGEKDQNVLEGLKNLEQILNCLANPPQV